MKAVKLISLVLVALTVSLAACSKTTTSGSSSPTPTPTPSPTETDTGDLPTACPTLPSGTAQLPSGFPALGGITFNTSTTSGPSTIVTGQSTTDKDVLFTALKSAFSSGGFGVTKAENDLHDAEVAFAGNHTTGQVALKEVCVGHTTVTVTIRPA